VTHRIAEQFADTEHMLQAQLQRVELELGAHAQATEGNALSG
jgi:hypothetical protein